MGSHTKAEWVDLWSSYGRRCAYCGGPGPLHRDHRVPLARGGGDEIGNIAPACASRNHRKHTLTDRERMVRLANERWRSDEFEVVDRSRRDQIQLVS